MPRLSDSMEEATVTRWLKRPGDTVARGEELVEVETDKATVVYEAEVAGVLEEILVDEGATAALGAPIARLRTEGGGAGRARGAAPAACRPPRPSLPLLRRRAAAEDRARATPVARRLANDLGVGLDGIAGSRPGRPDRRQRRARRRRVRPASDSGAGSAPAEHRRRPAGGTRRPRPAADAGGSTRSPTRRRSARSRRG